MSRINAWFVTWVSALKGWMPWITGDSPVPDHRARKVLAGTAGVLVMLLIGAFLLIGGPTAPSPAKGSGHQPATTPTTAVPPPASAASSAPKPAVPATTAPSPTTTVAPSSTSTTTAKRQHRHRLHARSAAGGQLTSQRSGPGR